MPRSRRAAIAFLEWRDLPGPHAGRARPAARRGAAPREGVARRARHARGRQDRPGGARRGAGDDRHLRLRGRSLASARTAARSPRERPGHRLTETWHPLGPVAVISAFNFPVAVWSWNAALALVCGDPVIWKPSERTPLDALACMPLLEAGGRAPRRSADGLAELVLGGADRPVQLADDPRIPLVSATGSTQMGRESAPRIAAPPRPLAARARRQQRRDRRAERRPRPRRARRPVLGRRHCRPALHEPAPADRARVDRRRGRRPPRLRLRQRPDRRSARAGDARRPARSATSAFDRLRGWRSTTRAGRTARSSPAASARSRRSGRMRGTRARRSSGCRPRPRSSSGRRSRRCSTC